MKAMNQRLYDDIAVCGRLPRREDLTVDLLTVSKLLANMVDHNQRVAVLRRLLEHNTLASNSKQPLPGLNENYQPIIFGRLRRVRAA